MKMTQYSTIVALSTLSLYSLVTYSMPEIIIHPPVGGVQMGPQALPSPTRQLFIAFSQGDLETATNIIDRHRGAINLSALNEHENTLLLEAISLGYSKMVQDLINIGANVNEFGGDGYTPLWLAAMKGNDEIVQTLIDAGAHVNTQNAGHGTALQAAQRYHHPQIVTLLREAGAH